MCSSRDVKKKDSEQTKTRRWRAAVKGKRIAGRFKHRKRKRSGGRLRGETHREDNMSKERHTYREGKGL